MVLRNLYGILMVIVELNIMYDLFFEANTRR